MVAWRKTFKEHAVHSAISDFNNLLKRKSVLSLKANHAVSRLKKVSHVLNKIVCSADPDLFPKATLDNLTPHIVQANANIKEFIDTRQTSHLTSAAIIMDSILNTLGSGVALLSGKKVIHDISYKQQKEDIEASLSTLSERTIVWEEKIKTLENNYNKKLSDLSTLDKKILVSQNKLNSSLKLKNEAIEAENAKREAKFTSLIGKINEDSIKEIKKLTNNTKSSLNGIKNTTIIDIKKLKEDAELKHKEIKKLYGLVGKDSISGEFNTYAGEEKELADKFRTYAIWSILLAVFWDISFYIKHDFDLEFNQALSALPITFLLLILATYCGKQSAKHRLAESQSKRFALETNALPAYLEQFSKGENKDVLKTLAEKYFGRIFDKAEGSTKDDILNVEMFMDKVKSISLEK